MTVWAERNPAKFMCYLLWEIKYKINVTFLTLVKEKPSLFQMVTRCQAKLLT